MVGIVEIEEVPGNIAQLEKDLAEAVVQPAATPAQTPATPTPAVDDRLPPKLRGKKLEDIVEMYTNLESQYGRMANDLGQQRKLTDRLLDLKRETDLQSQTPPRVDLKGADLLENPAEALDRFLAAREASRTNETAQRLQELELRLARQTFTQRHPDYEQYSADQGFHAWVASSPYRQRVGQAAAQGDLGAADELLTEYKERQKAGASVPTPTPKPPVNDGLAAARAASLESSAAPSGDGAGRGKVAGKVYRRADLLLLKMQKPDVYYDDTFQAEILRAYSEGRVK